MLSSQILWRLSGGLSNTDPASSLGGAMSSSNIVTNVVQNLFANILTAERTSGSTKYRCFYVANSHPTQTLESAVIYLPSGTPSPGTAISMGIDPTGINGSAAVSPDEDTAPAGVVFDHSPSPTSRATGLIIGDLEPGDFVAVWLRRVTDPGTVPLVNDPFTVAVHGSPV